MLYSRSLLFIYFIFLINFYWSIVALQCCASLYCTAKYIYIYIYLSPLFFGFPSHLGHHRALSRVFPELYSQFSLIIYFIHSISSVYMSIPISQFIPPSSFPPLVSIHFFLYVCVSISALQIRSSIPFF